VFRDLLVEQLDVSPERIHVVPNLAPDLLADHRDESLAKSAHILFLGRLGPHKGLPVLLEALATPRLRVLDWRATLAGDGDKGTYRKMADSLGIGDRVEIRSWVGRHDAAHLLRESSVLVLPSRAEGMPVAILEGFSAAVPVVATAVGAIPEVVATGRNGIVISEPEAEPLADALERIVADSAYREVLSRGARTSWQQLYDSRKVARRVQQIWRAAAERPGTAP
jgi:glycosyltransferase involved in cell wall biosynthesis